MRARRYAVILLVLGMPAIPLAFGGDAKPATGSDKYDPDNRVHISKYMETLVRANAKAVSRDFPGAIELYREAIQLQPTHPLGHYLLGEAQSASGNLTEAEASWTQADNVADKYPDVKTRVLFCIADLRERQKKWDDAKTAWQHYKEYVSAHADAGGFPASADARIQAIDEAMKQDKAYDIVRQRIAAEKDAGK